MDNEFNSPFDDFLSEDTLKRCERMLEKGIPSFFDVEDFQNLIFHYSMDGRYKKALQILETAKRQHPQSVEIAITEADLLNTHSRSHQALEIINRVAIIEPFNLDVLLMKGTILLNCNKPDEAEDTFEQAVDLTQDPEEKGQIYLDLGFMLSDYDMPDRSLQVLKKSLSFPGTEAAAMTEMSFVFGSENKFEEGIAFFNQYIDEHPYSYQAWDSLASVYSDQDMHEKALFCLEYAVLVNPNLSFAHHKKGSTLRKLNHMNEALEAYKEAAKLETGSKNIHYKPIADIYAQTGEFYSAEKYYLKICRTENSPFGKEILSECYASLSQITAQQERMTEAYKYALKAVDASPGNFAGRLNLAEMEAALNEDTAEDHFAEAVKLNKSSEEARVKYAEYLYNKGREQDAFELYKEACDELPQSSAIYYSFAGNLIKSGRFSEAEPILETALILKPEEADDFLDDLPAAENLDFVIDLINMYNT